MVFKHILHQPTRYTIFPNDKLCGFNSLEHNSERTLFRGSIKCLKKYCRKYWIFTYFTRFDNGNGNLGLIYPQEQKYFKCRGDKSALTYPTSVHWWEINLVDFPTNLQILKCISCYHGSVFFSEFCSTNLNPPHLSLGKVVFQAGQ